MRFSRETEYYVGWEYKYSIYYVLIIINTSKEHHTAAAVGRL